MNEYNIGYLDGRNHALELVSSWARKKAPDKIFQVLSDRRSLETSLSHFDPGFFNNYDEDIGPID